MPILKQIAGHTNCQMIKRYLEKNDRAIGRDFFNLSWDEREDVGDEADKAAVEWADEMDDTRRRAGNDMPFRGSPARTYKHFVISPDPEDAIDLPSLRELTCAWVLRYFDEYQVAVIYHNDNEGRIPHAHVVVNNTNLRTGNRMHHDDPLEFNRSLQDMARERGLSGLSNVRFFDEGLAQLAEKELLGKTKPRTLQNVYLGRKEKEIAEAGGYSWVADVRNRVSVAKALARNESEFRQILELIDVNIADSSVKAKREDWIFSLVDMPTKRVSGSRLGLLFAKETIVNDFARASAYHPSAKSSRELLHNARHAVLLNNLADLGQLSMALNTCAKHGVSSIRECDARIKYLEGRATSADEKQAGRFKTEAQQLSQARDFMSERGLLPEQIAVRSAQSRPTSKHKSTRQKHDTEQSRSRAQQQQQAREAQDRKER